MLNHCEEAALERMKVGEATAGIGPVHREVEAFLPTRSAEFRAIGYRAADTGAEHIALVLGDVAGREDVLTRLHSVCLTGDVFGSLRCDCGPQLERAMELIAEAGEGVVVYNPTHEGRGTGLLDKLAAYRLQERGLDTAEANEQIGHPVDARQYAVDAQILLDLGVASVRLLTNNPEKIGQLRQCGVEVSSRVPLWVGANPHNRRYLETKATRLGHLGDDH
ncbi:MAG: GTP cyclohydrolase II [Actinomycetota bacterium]